MKLFGKLKLRNPEFHQLKNKYEKYIFCCAFVIITQWVSIFNNFKKLSIIFFKIKLAQPFISNISCKYNICDMHNLFL